MPKCRYCPKKAVATMETPDGLKNVCLDHEAMAVDVGKADKLHSIVEHKPDASTWQVVSKYDDLFVAMAMCKCGDENCHFTASVYDKDFIHIASARKVWVD